MVNASAETQSVQLTRAGSSHFFVRSESGNFYVNACNDIEKIKFIGGSGDDNINTGSYGMVVKGGGGTDVLNGQRGADTLNGGVRPAA